MRIAPNPGSLKHVSAEMPHPHGTIRVDLRQEGAKLKADIELPASVGGEFEWRGQEKAPWPGKNSD